MSLPQEVANFSERKTEVTLTLERLALFLNNSSYAKKIVSGVDVEGRENDGLVHRVL